MNGDRFFMDTSYVLALLNSDDIYYPFALELVSRVSEAKEVWLTSAILVEIGDALCSYDRNKVIAAIKVAYETPNVRIVHVSETLLFRALQLYEARTDKTYGLTDCISFITMKDHQLIDALTTDRHFKQAGFRAILLDE